MNSPRFWLLVCVFAAVLQVRAAHRTENVILITFDGLRWQEVFQGVDPELFTAKNVNHFGDAKKMFWRDTPEARREALLPFLWKTVARHGQLFGNTNRGSIVRVTNGKNFSYPGYQELLCGYPDDRIDSNNAGPNVNATILEWLNARPGFTNRVAAFASWQVFRDIINPERSGVFVNAGNEMLHFSGAGPRVGFINKFMRDTLPPWESVRWDSITFQAAQEYLRAKKPRVIYIAFDETDDWAHDGDYARVLRSAHQADRFIQKLWETAQALDQYRGKTALVITTDHGRGNAPTAWRDHGGKTEGADYIWVAVMGPDTPHLGERSEHEPLTQSQTAATVAALLKQDYNAAVPRAAKPIPSLVQPAASGSK